MQAPRVQPAPAQPSHPSPGTGGGGGGTVAGRYRLLERINERGASEVHRAWDKLTGAEVALKLLPARADAPQLRAEVAALRLLHLPGVARLLDEGLHGERPFLVLELVSGTPFPGDVELPTDWPTVRNTVVSLLEILARVHNRGVVHRDLKPDNILVDEGGRPVVLDFGLSAGRAIGSGRNPDQRAVGTPAFAAPEQILGEPIDARADLYSLGVMLYEVLAGRRPQDAVLPDELIHLRLNCTPEPLAQRARGVPHEVMALVDDLLARDPARRPRSAADALARLSGRAARGPEPELPWLGGLRKLDAVRAAIAGGRPVGIVGESGSGRSRLLREVATRLRAEGRSVVELRSGAKPLSSLGALTPREVQLAPLGLDGALALARENVLAALGAGAVVLVDGTDSIDRWSSEVLADLSAETLARTPPLPGVLVVAGTDDDVTAMASVRVRSPRVPPRAPGEPRPTSPHFTVATALGLDPLGAHDLCALFAGPDRVFHLCEDGARELWRRTEGHPARVTTEVAAWLRAGLARWSGAKLVVRRQALGRLGMGLEVVLPERSTALAGRRLGEHLERHLAWVVLAGGEASCELLAQARGLPAWHLEAEQLELIEAGALRRIPGPGVSALVHPHQLDTWSDAERAEAHGRLAQVLTPGTPGRLLHLISAGRLADVPDEAEVLARRHLDQGQLTQAEAVLVEGLAAARLSDGWRHAAGTPSTTLGFGTGAPDAVSSAPRLDPGQPGLEPQRRPGAEQRLLAAWLAVALSEFTPQALDRVLYELARSGAGALERFAHAALVTLEHPGERALAELGAVEPLDDPELERWRHALFLQAGRGASAAREEQILAANARWCEQHDSPATRASLAEWTGRLRYRQDRHVEAAQHFEQAASGSSRVTSKLSALLNGASALLEAGHHVRASELAVGALELAAACRHEFFELRAEWILRAAAYRRGSADEPDLELVEAAGRVGVPDQEALIALNEAAAAWRAQHPAAADLARRAVALWAGLGKTWGTVLASALALAAEGSSEPRAAELGELAARALECPDPSIGGQSLALLVHAGAPVSEGARALAERLASATPDAARGLRREVLSVGEVLAALA
ncbi:MAG: protein kinase [Planctomycetota bacterium]|nr:protein kinase [Planctomycetota bacterium]